MARYSNLSKNIETIIDEIHKLGGNVRSNKFVKHMEDLEFSKRMTHQTTRNALNEAVKRSLIDKIIDKSGNQERVSYSTDTEGVKNEQKLLDQADASLKWFDSKYDEFKKNYQNLPIYYKAEGVDFFVFFLKAFKQTIETLESYSPSGKWENLQKQVDLRAGDLAHLLKSATTDEGLYILKKLVGFLIDDLEGAREDIDEYIETIKKFPNYKTKDLGKSPI